ncbi:MAG TPA: hypothetical protein VH054_22450 [Polyangiaceae bacterium]|jgi:hypothetical protein|nr:hypothetical protein [Polyangiaceae bacterium]
MRALSIFSFLAVVVACSNNDSVNDAGTDASTGDAGGDSGDPTKACNDEATALCGLRDSCSPGYDIMLVYGSTPTCVSRVAQACIGALSAKGTGNDASLVETCAGAYPSETCTSFFDGDPVAACVPTAGTLATGAACGASAQCASTYCAVTSTTVCGTCQPLPAAGTACQMQADCGRDLACATPTLAVGDAGVPAPKCAAFVASGGSCLTGYQPCQAGLSCVGDDEATMKNGTCQTSGATVGAACDGTRKTAPGCFADLGLVCIPTAKGSAVGTCKNIQIVSTGATCGAIGSMPITGFAVCGASGLCKKAASTDTNGTCVAAAADGAACDSDPANGPPCLSPAKCVSTGSGTAGTCTPPNASTCM